MNTLRCARSQRGWQVSANLWTVLAVRPLPGRVFTEDEDARGVRAAVISHGLWQRRFGGSPDVLGRNITLNDNSYERTALGAGRGRLITQFLIESLVLAGLCAIAGLALAAPVMRYLE